MAALYERVRPRDFDAVVGQDAIIRRLKSLEQRNALGGRAYWISGLSGTGKTTLAKIIANKVASDFATTEIPVKQLDAKALDDWERSTRMKCIDGRGHALIVNEAHGLKPNTIYQLLDVLERLRDYCVVIFTTTNEGQAALFEDCMDTAPLLSRCVNLQLQSSGADLELAFAIHVRKVAQAENLDGRPIGDYVNLVRRHKHNLRACFQSVDSGELL
jgi:replication-associated recombination protein RarA